MTRWWLCPACGAAKLHYTTNKYECENCGKEQIATHLPRYPRCPSCGGELVYTTNAFECTRCGAPVEAWCSPYDKQGLNKMLSLL